MGDGLTRPRDQPDTLNDVSDREQLMALLDRQASYEKSNPVSSEKKIGDYLQEEARVTQAQMQTALATPTGPRNKKPDPYTQDMGALSDAELHRVLARKLGIPYIDLSKFNIDKAAIQCIPLDIARKYLLLPLCFNHDRLVVAMDDPANLEAVDTLQFITNRHLELATASRQSMTAAIAEYYGDEETIEDDIIAAELKQHDVSDKDQEERELQEAERLGKEKPIVRLVNKILLDGIAHGASDIHVRPLENTVDLLFRIDGVLVKIRSFGKSLLPAVICRIKVLGKMNISERRLPQDGRARIVGKNNVVDMRISIIPTVSGESVVIRLLNSQLGLKSVEQLGFNPQDEASLTDMLHKSYGLVLVTGPTGSGKSTTLYAALQALIAGNVNIITVEDPVEYHIDGIEQIHVNTVPGFTFARALRNILRHDPDVIMIGEIRDQETGKIAIESALTGHLVLSTLHTNDAAGAVTRLMEMGIEPYLLNATLLGVIAQRLVRRNCPHCIQVEKVEDAIRRMLDVDDEEVFYKGQGCEHCHNTGYSGRAAVYELLRMTLAMHALIEHGVSADTVHAQAVKDGMTPLTGNALALARKRTTSLAEVYRVRLE